MKHDALIPQRRFERRSNVYLEAAVVADGVRQPGLIRDISVSGAMVECKNPPGRGSSVWLKHKNLLLAGSVSWVRGQRFATVFSKELSDAVLKAAVGARLRVTAPAGYEGRKFTVGAPLRVTAPGRPEGQELKPDCDEDAHTVRRKISEVHLLRYLSRFPPLEPEQLAEQSDRAAEPCE